MNPPISIPTQRSSRSTLSIAPRMASRLARFGAVSLVVAFASISTAASVLTPAFEAPDEPSHFGYVRHLVAHRSIPILGAGTTAAHEAGQPPLYYLVAALATLPIGDWTSGPTALPTWADHNPHASFGVEFRASPDLANRNLYAHGVAESFPWRGDVLALHVARLVSVAFGALAVLATILLVREIAPNRRALALAAGALLALNPQFAFISGVASNDSAAAGTASLLLYFLARALRRGLTVRRAAGVGAAVGLAALAKLSVLAIAPVVGLALIAAAPPRALTRADILACIRGLVPPAFALGGTALAVGGWWYALNLLNYGDPTAWQPMLVAQGTMIRPATITFGEAVAALVAARDTYWATFGWTNVLVARRFYLAADLLVAAGVVGLLVAALRAAIPRLAFSARRVASPRRAWEERGRAPHTLLFLGVWVGIVAVSLVRWVQLNTAAAQGRLLFPAAGAVAILLAFGLAALLPRRAEPLLPLALAAALLLFDRGALGGALLPAFQPTAPVAASELVGVRPLDGVCDCGIEFVGYRYVQEPRVAGDSIVVDVFWKTIAAGDASARNWSFHVGLLDPAGAERAKTISWPDAGRRPTTATTSGEVYRERIVFRLPAADSAPGLGTITVTPNYAVEGAAQLARIASASAKAGTPSATSVSPGRFRWPSDPIGATPRRAIDTEIGNGLRLIGVDAPDTAPSGAALPIRLYWRADRPQPFDYTESLQVFDERGAKVGQIDSQPRSGRYPMTAWPTGEVVADDVTIPVAAGTTGRLRVLLVVYRLDNGERLAPRSISGAASSAISEGGMIEVAAPRIGN